MRLLMLALLLVAAPATTGGEPGPERTVATSLGIVEPAFHGPRIDVALSNPPQFDVVFQRPMPTPGWRIAVDDVEIDEAQRRIVARISEIAPTGNTAQVITDTDCRVPLGRLGRGLWVLELRVRRGDTRSYLPAHAVVLRAR